MRQLQDLEVLEIQVLDHLNSLRLLESLFFGGGTMLRLCHNLNRYSTDLDFWLDASADPKIIFTSLKKMLSEQFRLTDSMNKRNTFLFEFRAPGITRSLKIEIRKGLSEFKWERKIAFSKFSTQQVMVKGLTLEQMMKNKCSAFVSRKLIRDAFDIEFLIMRGLPLPSDRNMIEKMLNILNSFREKDYKVVLGSLLEPGERAYYISNRFRLLKEEISKQLLML
ncbi:MAG TPA: nucleotidyl transferase AbiEii/AbiGii toxin family protein [Cyclobacteriaceae bacterium]|nr:nucleotidyl transferase AbiEii/AbiGii toxin family protein [Cyclobacteriaceae bacterium]